MDKLFYLAFSIVTPLFVLLGPKGMLTVRLIESINNKKMDLFNKINCYVPFYNSYRIRVALNGEAKFFKAFNRAGIIIFSIALVVRFIVPSVMVNESMNTLLQVIVTALLLAFILIAYITEVYIAFDLCRMFDKGKIAIFSLIPMIANALVIPAVAPYFKKYRTRLEGTFNGNSSK